MRTAHDTGTTNPDSKTKRGLGLIGSHFTGTEYSRGQYSTVLYSILYSTRRMG